MSTFTGAGGTGNIMMRYRPSTEKRKVSKYPPQRKGESLKQYVKRTGFKL